LKYFGSSGGMQLKVQSAIEHTKVETLSAEVDKVNQEIGR
jgi:hypothetical protein